MQIYRVLIVDDEPYIVQCLSVLLESQKDMNLDICQAYSAQEALKYLENQRIDILISDIEMPGMSGIELIKMVKERWVTCKVIILTAHEDFEYAYQSYHLDVVSYILKTETDDYIIAEVKKAIRLLDEELNQTLLITSNLEDLVNNINVVRRELFFSLLDNRIDFSMKEQYQILKMIGFDKPINNLILLSGKISNISVPMEPSKADSLAKAFYTVKMIMSHYITSKIRACACETNENKIYWLLQPYEYDDIEKVHKQFIPWITGMLETVQQSCFKTSGIQISFVMTTPITCISQLSKAFRKGEILLHQLGIHQKDYIFTLDLAEVDLVEDYNYDFELYYKKFEFFLENENYSEFIKLLDDVLQKLGQKINMHDISVLQYYYSIVLFLLSCIKRRNLMSDVGKNINLQLLFFPHVFKSWNDAADYLRKLSMFLLEAITKDNEDFSKRTIQIIKEYIKEHIFDDVSLQQLSEVTGYNPSYLSRFFSEKTGEKLSEYIANQRMEYIKGLMKNTNLSLNDIAEKAGFQSRSYFNRFVKRITGTTPQKYRKKLID